MLERLSNLHQSRLAQKTNFDSHSAESAQNFLARFNQLKSSIESRLSCISSEAGNSPSDLSNSAKSELDYVAVSISDLEKVFSENTYFLPSYEIRSCLKAISDLRQSLDNVSSQVIPKKKFSFKSKKKSSILNPPSNDVVTDAECNSSVEKKQNLGAENGGPSGISSSSPGFRDKNGEVLVMEFGKNGEVGEFSLTGLTSCEVKLKGCLRSLFLNNLQNCKVYVGPVFGSVLIEDVVGCVFMLASHQIRIHNAKECDFYLRARSRPIIEYCCGVKFAPYCLRYNGIEEDLGEANLSEETGNWANVDDFRWLRAVQSPNWIVMPESERSEMVDI